MVDGVSQKPVGLAAHKQYNGSDEGRAGSWPEQIQKIASEETIRFIEDGGKLTLSSMAIEIGQAATIDVDTNKRYRAHAQQMLFIASAQLDLLSELLGRKDLTLTEKKLLVGRIFASSEGSSADLSTPELGKMGQVLSVLMSNDQIQIEKIFNKAHVNGDNLYKLTNEFLTDVGKWKSDMEVQTDRDGEANALFAWSQKQNQKNNDAYDQAPENPFILLRPGGGFVNRTEVESLEEGPG